MYDQLGVLSFLGGGAGVREDPDLGIEYIWKIG